MTLRDHLSEIKRQAHTVLDQVKAGVPVPEMRVRWALAVLGDVE
jgi:hypothetical protein